MQSRRTDSVVASARLGGALLFVVVSMALYACDGGDVGDESPSPGPADASVAAEPDLVFEACDPGATRCATLDVLLRCTVDGFGWERLACRYSEGLAGSCVLGECQTRICASPGTFERCLDATTELRCGPDATSWEELPCDGVCTEGSGCREQLCRPGRRRCRGDELLEECAPNGSGWSTVSNCKEMSRLCREGGDAAGAACVELCEVVRKERTYLGCEYWAVDLDNAFVPGGSQSGFHDAQGRQFAVVVSNVNPELEARATISTVDGPVYCAHWGRIPHVAGGVFPNADDAIWCKEDLDRCLTQERCTVVVTGVDETTGRDVWEEFCTTEGRLDCNPETIIAPGRLRVFNLPRRDVNGTMRASLGFRVESSIPINAYQFNPLENEQVFSNDASLLLPISTLGKHYMVMSREQTFDSLKTYITVVAVWPGTTEVFVTPTIRTLPGPGIPAISAGQRKSFTLQQFDVLNLESNCPADNRGYCRHVEDFTGSEVFADKPIAVFGGSEASNAPNTNHCVRSDPADELGLCWDEETTCLDNSDCSQFITCCADHLEQQLFPVETWGRHYLATKSFDRGEEADVWRILSQRDGTLVETIPHQATIPLLDRGEYAEFESREHFEIVASSAVLVGQFLAAEQAPDPNRSAPHEPGDAGTGDPAFLLAVPTEQYMDAYVILAPDKYEFDYASVTAPVGTTVLMDGEPVPPGSFELVGAGDYAVARLPITDGIHTFASLRPEEGGAAPPLGVIVYGYDQYVSYAYPGGLSLGLINTCRLDSDCPLGTDCVEGECVGP